MFSLRTVILAASVLGLFACSQNASSGSTDDATVGDESALVGSSCSPAAYNKALVRYKAAVSAAKRHATDSCGTDTYLSTIATEASAAVAECAAFSNVIKTSPWAQPIRTELADSGLVLAQLTGDFNAKDYSGLKASLEKGATMWGPAPGVYGNMSRLEFGANGKVKAWTLNLDDNTGAATWSSQDGTYTVGGVSGDTAGISVTVGGISVDYDLKASSENGYPDFTLSPIGDAPAENHTAYKSECEA